MKRNQIIAIMIALPLIASCGQRDDQLLVSNDTPASQIFAEAQKQISRGRGKLAGDYLLEVERLYPFTPEAQRALIQAAQAYHDDGALLESRIAAERYLQFFPGANDAPLAAYLVALSYYDGMVTVERDQERTFEALKALQNVMDTYPNSEYAAKSAPKFELALNQLAGKEVDIGRYYLTRKQYTAAIGRFKAVITEYPANKHKAEAYHRLIESYLALGLRDEVSATYAEMGKSYANTDWYARSTQLVRTGTQPNAGGNIFRQILSGTWQ